MFRLVPAFATTIVTLMTASAALAADYGDGGLRGSLPSNWGDLSDAGDPLEFEFGVRYSYTMSNHAMVENGNSYQLDDNSHAVEIYGRIDDLSTGTYLKGHFGYSAIFEGNASTPLTGGAVAIDSGHLAYANADFGYLGFGNGEFYWGPFAGYQYSGSGHTVNGADNVTVEMHLARLGLAAKGEMGDGVDVAAEVAIVPYSAQSGGATNGDSFDATLFGAMGEVSFGFHPYDNVVVSIGGRAAYLTDDFGAAGTDHSTLFNAGAFLGVGYSY